MTRRFLALLALLAFAGLALAQEHAPLTPDQVRGLLQVKYALAAVDDLESRGILARAAAEPERERLRARARELLGGAPLIDAAMADAEQFLLPGAGTPRATPAAEGLLTFVNAVWFLAGMLLVVSLGWLARLYLVPLLRLIPPSAYEALLYLGCVGLALGGKAAPADLGPYVALPGCLGLAGALAYTYLRHREAIDPLLARGRLQPATTGWMLLFAIWSGIALGYGSVMLGWLAVGAFQAWLGFSVAVTPLCYFVGFRDKDVIPRSMAASLVLIVLFAAGRVSGVTHPAAAIFAPGALFLGTFVYFTGLLIVSSRLYWRWGRIQPSRWLEMQGLTAVSGIAALWFGSVYDVGPIRGVGGTFFFLWVLEKYLELPWKKALMAWAALGLALLLYGGAYAVRSWPEYFLFGAK